jgi:dTDP-4-amino-4,6-dideoxygalactose transaminase
MKDETKIFVTKPYLPPFDEFVEGLREIWETKLLTNQGPIHNQFLELVRNYLKIAHLDLLVNGHQALEIAIRALDLTGEVITTPFSFASTSHAIVRCGLTPVFADIDPDTYNLAPSSIEPLITEKTSAIMPVHVYGTPCDIEGIDQLAKKYDLKVIYDAAHAFGVEIDGQGIGNFGDISMFSFHATKVFHSIEGGALAFVDEDLKRRVYLEKNFGIANAEEVILPGTNAKMNEFQALMGMINLRHIDEEIQKREKVVRKYREVFGEIDGIKLLPEASESLRSNFAYFPILIDEDAYGLSRNELFDLLGQNNIFARKYFYPLITDYNCYSEEFKIKLPIASLVADRVITLPLWGDIGDDTIARICSIITNEKNNWSKF